MPIQVNQMHSQMGSLFQIGSHRRMMAQIELKLFIFNNLSPTNQFNIGQGCIQLPSGISIMITTNQLDMTIQSLDSFNAMSIIAKHQITHMIYNIIGADNFIPILDNSFIMLLGASETTRSPEELTVVVNRNEYRTLKKSYSFLLIHLLSFTRMPSAFTSQISSNLGAQLYLLEG